MAPQPKKTKLRVKRKVLTKKDKIHRRVTRVHKAIARKKQVRTIKQKQASQIRKKIAKQQEHQLVQMAQPINTNDAPIDAELNLMNLLGLTGHQPQQQWEELLEKKLKEADDKSIDNPDVKRVYGQIGKIFTKYRSGKVPKAFKIIPNLEHWREVIELTRPEHWTSHAMLQAVTIFASNFDPIRAEQFYKRWLVPSVRRDLANSKKLNCHLFQALKKGLYKTNAWFKGVLFEFCGEDILLREIKVIESLVAKMSIPVIAASVAMLKLMQMPATTPIIHYLSAFLNKNYTLPKRVLNQMTTYLLSFGGIEQELSVAWQSFLLTLVKQYGQSLDQLQKSSLRQLCKHKFHKLITPEILKHLS